MTLIFLGAGVGGVCRALLGPWVQSVSGTGFPLGTLVVNVSGCFAAGFLAAMFAGHVPVRAEYREAILVGVLGGFTTFSAFARETMVLGEERRAALAAANVVLSVALGLIGAWAGARLAGRLWAGS